VPFWLRAAGVGLDAIGALSATGFAPHAFKILWIPALDVVGTKRGWYLAMAFATAGLLLAASLVPDPVHHLGLFVALVTAAQATATTGHAANNALMATTTRPEDKGKAGGFAMASNLGSTNLLGALALVVSDASSRRAAGALLAAIVVAGALCALRIVEVAHVRAAAERAAGALRRTGLHLADMARDLWRTVRSRHGFTGLVLCLAPVGCGALTNLFSGMASDYGAGANVVAAVNGVLGGVVSALGSLAGGFLADRMSRRIAYGMAGGLTALSAIAMGLAPMTPATYAWGTLAYSFSNGIAFATWAGMVLELVGPSAATATKYALFNAASNVSINYMTALDGRAARLDAGFLAGSRAMLGVDAALTAVGIAILLVTVAVVRRRDAAAAAPAGRT
jgi:PAT family beta-lactamase induction signal transducer AmpG